MRRAALALALATAAPAQEPATRPDPAARRMTAAAQDFLAAMPEAVRTKAVFPFAGSERTTWTFLPGEHPGVKVRELDLPGRRAAHDLLRAALSQKGYLKANAIFALENVLRAMAERSGGNAALRDPEHYAFAVFGTPSATEPWGWRVMGHHLSLHFTVLPAAAPTATPLFFGSNPAEVREGTMAGLRVLGDEEDLGRALASSLDAAQRAKALLPGAVPSDVILGPQRQADFLGAPKGVPHADLRPEQRELVVAILAAYAGNLRAELAEAQLARIRARGLDELCFAWSGETAPGKPHYWRLHGRGFAIEFDNTQNEANHVHTVWRDLETDFGRDPLREHLERDHRRR